MPPPGDPEAVEQELSELQAARRELTSTRRLLRYEAGEATRTENPKMGSVEEIVNDLLEVRVWMESATVKLNTPAATAHSR